jgi:hypothetical protein
MNVGVWIFPVRDIISELSDKILLHELYIISNLLLLLKNFFIISTYMPGIHFEDSLQITPGLCDVINAVQPVTKKPEVNLYPNPFHDYATLELSNFPATLEIYNLPGIKVSDQEIISNQTIIQTNHLENGFYFYFVKNSSGETSSGKFVKD